MKLTWEPPHVNAAGDAVEYRANLTMEMREIRAHPDRFKADIGDMYQGCRIVRDATIPLGEIHVIEGNRRMVLHYKESA